MLYAGRCTSKYINFPETIEGFAIEDILSRGGLGRQESIFKLPVTVLFLGMTLCVDVKLPPNR